MFAPSKMKKVQILVLDKDLRRVTVHLGRLETVHLATSTEFEASPVPSAVTVEEDLGRCQALVSRVRKIEKDLGLDAGASEDASGHPALDEIEEFLEALEPKLLETSEEKAEAADDEPPAPRVADGEEEAAADEGEKTAEGERTAEEADEDRAASSQKADKAADKPSEEKAT